MGPADNKTACRVDVELGVLSSSLAGMILLITTSRMSRWITSLLTVSLCWAPMTTASILLGTPYSYSTVTCDLPSGAKVWESPVLSHFGKTPA